MEWNIQARGHVCRSCEARFADKDVFHTLLFDVKGGYERYDVCQGCWGEQFSQGATEKKGFVSHWQSVYVVPPATPPEPIQKEGAEGLLRRLVEANDARHGAALYILAAMLERKRILKVKAQLVREGERVFVYEHGKSGDLFHIPDPNLQLQQLESVQREVLGLLEKGLGTGDSGRGTGDGGQGAGDGEDSKSQIADSRGEEGVVDGGRETVDGEGGEGNSKSQIADSKSSGEGGTDSKGGGPGANDRGLGGEVQCPSTNDRGLGGEDSRSQIADSKSSGRTDSKGEERVNAA